MKNVQISMELFLQLVDYFQGEEGLKDQIEKELYKKLDKLIEHELFTKYKRTSTGEEREQARQKYLKQKGINGDWCSEKEKPYKKM